MLYRKNGLYVLFTLLLFVQQLLKERRLFLRLANRNRHNNRVFNRSRKRDLLDRRLVDFLFFDGAPSEESRSIFFFLGVLVRIHRLFGLAGVLLQTALRSLGKGVLSALHFGLFGRCASAVGTRRDPPFGCLIEAAPKGIDTVERRLLGASLDIVGGGGLFDNDNVFVVATGGASAFGSQQAHRSWCVCAFVCVILRGRSNLAKQTPDLPEIVIASSGCLCSGVPLPIALSQLLFAVEIFARASLASGQCYCTAMLTWQDED